MKSARKTSTCKRPHAVFVSALLLALPSAQAATQTWNNTATDFNAAGSWTGTAPGAGDNATFTGGMVTNPNLSTSLTVQGLTFSSTTTSGYTLTATSGQSLTLTNVGTAASAAINAANTTGTNTISASLILGGAAATQAALTQAIGGTLAVSGNISSTNTEGVLVNGGGTVLLSGANTYTGATTVSLGTLQVGASTIQGTSGALGAGTNALTMSSTGFLDLSGFNVSVGALNSSSNGNRILNNSGAGTSILTVGNNNTTGSFGGLIVDNNNSTAGKVALVKEGTGTLTLSTANTFSGGVSIDNGVVVYSGNNNGTFGTSAVTLGSGANNAQLTFTGTAATLANNFTIAAGAGTRLINGTSGTGGTTISGTVALNKDLALAVTGASGAAFTLSGSISGSSGLVIDLTNIGTVNLRGNNTFSGGIAINAGTLQGQNTSSIGTVGAITSGALGTGAVTLGATSSSAAATFDFPLGYNFMNALNVASGGTRTISMSGVAATTATWSGPIALSNDLNLTAVATTLTTGANRLNIGNGSVGGGITGSNNVIITNANVATGAVAGSGAINLGGGSAPTAWTGNLIVQGGQGSISSVNAIGVNNTVGVASGATFNFSNTAAINPTIAGLSNATAGALGGSTGGTVLHTQANNRVLILGGSGNYTFSGIVANAINGTNTTGLTVALTGSGSQTLSGANTYTGITTVSGGTLAIGASDRIADASNLVMSGGTFATGGFNETLGTLTLSGSASIDFGVGTSALVFADSHSATWGSSISLTILNFTAGVDSLRFGTSSSGLTSAQLALLSINGSAALIDSNGFISASAIPEPSTYAALAGALALFCTAVCRRSKKGE